MSERAPEYEFNQAQNEIIGGLSAWMKATGWLLLVFSFVQLATFALQYSELEQHYAYHGFVLFNLVLNILVTTLYCFVSTWTRHSAAAFRAVVDTQGTDISHMMRALQLLRLTYTVMYWLLIASLALLGIWFVAGSWFLHHLDRFPVT